MQRDKTETACYRNSISFRKILNIHGNDLNGRPNNYIFTDPHQRIFTCSRKKCFFFQLELGVRMLNAAIKVPLDGLEKACHRHRIKGSTPGPATAIP